MLLDRPEDVEVEALRVLNPSTRHRPAFRSSTPYRFVSNG